MWILHDKPLEYHEQVYSEAYLKRQEEINLELLKIMLNRTVRVLSL